MEVPRSVILDLLPIYLADEASDDTRRLVQSHLEKDDDLAHLARQWKEKLPAGPPVPIRPEAQVEAYRAAQRQLTFKTVGLALVFTLGALLLVALVGLFWFLFGSTM